MTIYCLRYKILMTLKNGIKDGIKVKDEIFIHYIYSSDPNKPSPYPELSCNVKDCSFFEEPNKCTKKEVNLKISEQGVVCFSKSLK
jgi:hypothetical protein